MNRRFRTAHLLAGLAALSARASAAAPTTAKAFSVAFAVTLICPSAWAQTPPVVQAPWPAALAGLAGCWRSEGGEPGSGEQWMPPAGGTMLGLGRTVMAGRTVAHEFMQIRHDDAGRIVFIGLPSGQSATTFALLRQTEHEWVFENPAHDFPQRVIYRLVPPERLHARIEGVRSGRARSRDFPMRREACANPAPDRRSASSSAPAPAPAATSVPHAPSAPQR